MRRWIAVFVLVGLALGALPRSHAQDTTPFVAFVVDTSLQTASVIDPGPDGLTQLAEIFRSMGARTDYIRLSDPIPEDAAVIVIVRPWKTMPDDYLARLFIHMAHGGNVLWAIDPTGHVRSASDTSRSGIAQLVNTDYGIRLLDSFIFMPWFTRESITQQRTSYAWSYPIEATDHPVSEPLVAYDLPVEIWGARTITVEPIGLESIAAALIETRSGYGEANAKVFDTRAEPAPFEINLGEDYLGHLPVAALAEQSTYGSRMVLLGDSEIVQNDFGLALDSFTQDPLRMGDYLLTQRIAAWLLELPPEDWPPLPTGMTWLAVDGSGDDWDEVEPLIVDEADSPAPRAMFDIQQVRAFHDDSYLYLYIDTAEGQHPYMRALVTVEGHPDILAAPQQTTAGDDPVPDGTLVSGSGIEIRLPLRVTGPDPVLTAVCVSDSRTAASSAPLDCAETDPVAVPGVSTLAPFTLYFPDGPLVTVLATGVANLRTEPDTNSETLEQITNGQMFRALGRDESGDWIQVQDARHTGWIASFLLVPNVEIGTLPVTAEP